MTSPNDVAALVERLRAMPEKALLGGSFEADCLSAAATIAALQAEVERAKEEWAILPPLDDDMIRAALRAHYGKKALRELGIIGVDLTANDVNWTFKQGFSRMWSGVCRELAARSASRKEKTP